MLRKLSSFLKHSTFSHKANIKDELKYKEGIIKIGHWASLSKTYTEKEVVEFSKLSGDTNPIHLDETFATKTRFKKRIVHGFLYSSLISAVAGTTLPGPGTVYISQTLQFKKPVYFGDTIEAIIQVIDRQKSFLTFQTQCFNQNGDLVVDGNAVCLVPPEKLE